MNYPVIIESEKSLIDTLKEIFRADGSRIFADVLRDQMTVRTIVREVSKQTVSQMLIQTGQIKKQMTLSKCYNHSTRHKVDNAIKTGELKFIVKGANRLVSTDEFFKWLFKDQIL